MKQKQLQIFIGLQLDEMKKSISELLDIDAVDVGITATTGEDLTAFGKGEGIQVLSIVTAMSDS